MSKIVNISFIGFGNMGKAIADGWLNQSSCRLFAASPSLKKGFYHGIVTDSDNCTVASKADILILAVKPDMAAQVLDEIKPVLSKHCVIISIAAGLSLHWLSEHCPTHQPIVRCMPNIAVSVKKGATALVANPFVTEEQKRQILDLFGCLGLASLVEKEQDLNAYTALSGSGPAYVFLLMESMSKAAGKLGLDEARSSQFAIQTFAGALEILKSGFSPEEARLKVTSKGGTTEAAIRVFGENHFEDLVFEAMKAACMRAEELNK